MWRTQLESKWSIMWPLGTTLREEIPGKAPVGSVTLDPIAAVSTRKTIRSIPKQQKEVGKRLVVEHPNLWAHISGSIPVDCGFIHCGLWFSLWLMNNPVLQFVRSRCSDRFFKILILGSDPKLWVDFRREFEEFPARLVPHQHAGCPNHAPEGAAASHQSTTRPSPRALPWWHDNSIFAVIMRGRSSS